MSERVRKSGRASTHRSTPTFARTAATPLDLDGLPDGSVTDPHPPSAAPTMIEITNKNKKARCGNVIFALHSAAEIRAENWRSLKLEEFVDSSGIYSRDT